MNRKVPMRDAYARKMREEGRWTSFDRKTERDGRVHYPPKRHAPPKKVSRRQRERQREYFAAQRDFLAEHPACAICLVRGMGAAPASEVHHLRGRAGRLLCDVRFFVPSCRGCREWPHTNPREARALGVLAEAWEWNVWPGNY